MTDPCCLAALRTYELYLACIHCCLSLNDAALIAALADEVITQRHLEESIRCNPSSLAKASRRNPIGYRTEVPDAETRYKA